MAAEGLCWCSSESKCPHGISAKIPALWEDMEQMIDEVLQQFDRKSIKRFLRGEGVNKGNVAEQMKSSAYRGNSPDKSKRSRTADPSPTSIVGAKRPTEGLPNVEAQRPKTQQKGSGFQRNLMSTSLPRLPNRPPSPGMGIGGIGGNSSTWAGNSGVGGIGGSGGGTGISGQRSLVPPPTSAWEERAHSPPNRPHTRAQGEGGSPIDLPGETTISVGLMRIADKLARLVLPWQAVLCPRAVETLYDLRKGIIQSRHGSFIDQMKAKLDEKVMGFIRKKEEEVEVWMDNEIKGWRHFMTMDESELSEYIKADLGRISDRAMSQDRAYRARELSIATNLDDHERDSTREQLVTFRRICRQQGGGNMEVKLLQDSLAKAQSTIHKKIETSNREVVRKQEEAHDWLCSLADNAVTASQSEHILKHLYAALDREKARGMGALHLALTTYKEQHAAILEAIVVFTGRIHQHATDYLQREQLVARAFLQYLLSVVTGEIKTHTQEQKKDSYAWETKTIGDRGHRKEMQLIADFNQNIKPLDRLTADFKDRMRVQLEHVTIKLQSVLNGRENDVNTRKARIHKKLARHVNKACNARRLRLKDSTAVRRDEFDLESKCFSAVDGLAKGLRESIDQVWVREHLKERRIHEAATGRMERLEKSALIIWNKHSHMAIDQSEEYGEWMEMCKKERDLKIHERRTQIDRDYRAWRGGFGKSVREFALAVRAPVKALVYSSFEYDVSEPVEDNLLTLQRNVRATMDTAFGGIHSLRRAAQDYLQIEIENTDRFSADCKGSLLLDWQEQLFLLNSSINRRVGGLKDMEADLEETIRMSILQHEVENGIFEQLSCSRLEHFWLEWRAKMFNVSKDIREQQEDYQISKNAGEVKSRATRKDRDLDDLVLLAKDDQQPQGGGQGLPSIGGRGTGQGAQGEQGGQGQGQGGQGHGGLALGGAEEEAQDHYERVPSDTTRLKRILDTVKLDHYREFTHKLTRGLEKIRRDFGEGKKRLVPPYCIAKTIIACCDVFWEKAKLSERCVGRISSRGVLLFAEGLPLHARALFGVASSMYVVQAVTLREEVLGADCDDVFEFMGDIKQVFMIGLLAITQQIGEFGDYFLRSECIWACSCFGMEPPAELVKRLDAKGLDKSYLEADKVTGFYSDDPVDLSNSLLLLTTELMEVRKLQAAYREGLLEADRNKRDAEAAALLQVQREAMAAVEAREEAAWKTGVGMGAGLEEDSVSVAFTNDESYAHARSPVQIEDSVTMGEGEEVKYRNNTQKVYKSLSTSAPYLSQMHKLAHSIPAADAAVMAAFLGRPEGSMELTPHRVCQVVTFWRRTALSIIQAAFDPPSTEYPRVKDLVNAHAATISGTRRTSAISCLSPFEAVSTAVDWVTSIKGLPLSYNQGLCIISRGGGCDPWLEDPRQTGRAGRVIYELKEFMESIASDIPKSMNHSEYLQAAFPKHIDQMMKALDLNFTGVLPLEVMRSYLQREDVDLSNTQISLIFWCLCRVEESDDATVGNSLHDSYQTFQTGGVYRPIVQTHFAGLPEAYMLQFAADVDTYLNSMPTIDTNVILGFLPAPLVPASAHELVSDATKLDASAKNAMPSSCCVWLGARAMHLKEVLGAITVDTAKQTSRGENILLGVGKNTFQGRHGNRLTADLRTYVEVDLLSKYPELCETMASNKHYGPAGNEPILAHQGDNHDDHWHELMSRRLLRMDKLTVAWRDTMMNEWSTSLYQSRQTRYLKRVEIVNKCVGVYHKQYSKLRLGIISERTSFIARFAGIQSELLSLIQDDYNFFSYHCSFLERSLRRYEGQMDRLLTVLGDVLREFQRHAGSIKRRGISRIAAASERLRSDLEQSCSGLIMGYTAGFAQGFFDELIYRGEVWRSSLTDVQGRLILEKEKFASAKEEIDRDLTIQISDRVTLDRNTCKGHMENLAADTASMLDTISGTRAAYAAVQKDANARLIIRIEKAVRESRKLRAAAEQMAELEVAAMRDIRKVLDTARHSCVGIVAEVKASCLKQIAAIQPSRKPHRARMEARVKGLQRCWGEVEAILQPLVDDYRRELYKHLKLTKAQCMDVIGKYREREARDLEEKYRDEREGLIGSFRQHFRDYDLSEGSSFDRFNREVFDTLTEMNLLWGPSKPRFIAQGLAELDNIVSESLRSGADDVVANMHAHQSSNDDATLGRLEVVDVLTHSLSKSVDYCRKIPVQFINEKKNQMLMVDEMSMEKNGDMVRPQVKAVLDLLVSGIEIDSDFGKGYESLMVATQSKAVGCTYELQHFYSRYSNHENPLGIDYSAALTMGRIDQRRQEVVALLDASDAHLVADHSRLDVLLGAGEKDIEEWASLTLQLVENAFNNAEQSYLSNLWPTPPTTPRLELLAEDEDRVGQLKALLAVTHDGNLAVRRPGGVGGGGGAAAALALAQPEPGSAEEYALAILGGQLDDDSEVQDQLRVRQKETRRVEKESRRLEKEKIKHEAELKASALVPPKVKPEETRELQEGWFECCTAENYTYYFNPTTEESLWQLPLSLLRPKAKDELLIETPRDLLMLSDENQYAEEVIPLRMVSASYSLHIILDPAVLMSQIAEEARAAVALAVDTALDVTTVIRGRKGRNEKTIAALLGDKFNPLLRKDPFEEGDNRGVDVDEEEEGVELTADGRLISDSGGPGPDPEMAQMLAELGLGSQSEYEGGYEGGSGAGGGGGLDVAIIPPQVLPSVAQEIAAELTPPNQTQWLNLGLGATQGEGGDSSDEEGYRDQAIQRRAESRYAQSRETDQMGREDEMSIQFENYEENSNCNDFLHLLQQISATQTATLDNKVQLEALGRIIKPQNLVDIMDTLKTSWRKLDDIIRETEARHLARQALQARVQTEEGMARQQTILEHSEDIEEMQDFLHVAGLAKTAAKRVATELVLQNISTPKKLAKIWSRQHITLSALDIDPDDVEEVEAALQQLLSNNANNASFNNNSFGYGFGGGGSGGLGGGSFHPSTSNAYSLNLDPALVTEVEDVDIDEDEGEEGYEEGEGLGTLPSTLRRQSSRAFSYTKDGYKSFANGWVEGQSEEGHAYFWNITSGESSWTLPGAREGDEEELIDDHRETVGVEGEWGGEEKVPVHEPSNTFAHSYEYDPEAYTDYPEGGYQDGSEYYQGSQLQVEQHAYHDAYAYDNTAYDTEAVYYDEAGHPYHYDAQGNAYYAETAPYTPYTDPQTDPTTHPHYPYPTAPHHASAPHPDHPHPDQGTWELSDALGDHSHVLSGPLRRELPVPPKEEVLAYSRKEGVSRQLALLAAQDRWQNALVRCQHSVTAEKSHYLQMRVEMFEKVSSRVDTRLNSFVEDIKIMQKTLKKDLGDSMSTERDLRRLLDSDEGQIVRAEKLSFILESLEKFKGVASDRYESAFSQIDKFGSEWELLKTELTQVGDIFDEGVAANLEQCRMTCEHSAKLFAYDQLKVAGKVKTVELRAMRNAVHRQLRADGFEQQVSRREMLLEYEQYRHLREAKRASLTKELGGWSRTIEAELADAGFPPTLPETSAVSEEEGVMSYMLTQVEMELSLRNDYDSITEATKTIAMELQEGIKEFDRNENGAVSLDGSWYNKHRETLERHEQALHVTLTKVRNRMNEGYQLLNAKLEALDFDVEKAAEEELFQSQSQASLASGEEVDFYGDD